jgi:hypothetical protein
MLQQWLDSFTEEFSLPVTKLNAEKSCTLSLSSSIPLSFKDLETSGYVTSHILSLPKEHLEELFIFLMKANLLGQGTGPATIGIDASEKFLTLSMHIPYEGNYRLFKEQLEDFVNYLLYWREEVPKFQKKLSERIY